MDLILNKEIKSIRYAEEGFSQILKFSYQKEKPLPNGIKSMYSFSRRVQIRYVGLRDGLHKFQLGTIRSEFSLSRMADPTAELSKNIHRALSLLVLGANQTGRVIKIYNLPYIQYRWEELKKEFLQDYDREEYLILIREMDQRISSESLLIAYLQLPSMYGLYFNGYWEAPDKTEIVYGKEVSELSVDELLTSIVQKNQIQKQIIIYADYNSGHIDTSIQNYTGTCIYLDGILDTCKKQLQSNSTKFYYSAKWVGLKKLFQ